LLEPKGCECLEKRLQVDTLRKPSMANRKEGEPTDVEAQPGGSAAGQTIALPAPSAGTLESGGLKRSSEPVLRPDVLGEPAGKRPSQASQEDALLRSDAAGSAMAEGPRVSSAGEDQPPVDVCAQNAHAVRWEQLRDLLSTDTVKGLSSEEAARRLIEFGKNKLAEKSPEPFWHKVFRQINSILIYLLLIAAIVAGGFQEWVGSRASIVLR
jgi:magnesium-transporting ATPase (P-type)